MTSELVAQIYEKPEDPGTYIVYGDWLQGRGDPRGKLIAAQAARLAQPDSEALVAAEAEILAGIASCSVHRSTSSRNRAASGTSGSGARCRWAASGPRSRRRSSTSTSCCAASPRASFAASPWILARDAAWASWVGGLVVRSISAWQRRIARKRGIRAPLTGAVTFVQRFG
jgi:uncharacterized protein (TIGR02996 family)